ncbi:MAG: ion channel [Chloroflexi bacterium]|nr:ion channel [Chloroflexota bacterium]
MRLYRVYRVIYYLRRRDGMSLLKEFFANRGETAVLTLSLAVILLFEFASIAILRAEAVDVNANITTPGDAVWWLMVTIATVGYGDSYPVTARGRLIASLVIVAGVGLFGILSGFLARTFRQFGWRKSGCN